MLEIIFKSIPKTSNEIIFVLGILGLCVLFSRHKKNIYVHAVLCISLGMITWRTAYGIISGRYASCLIILFSISAAYFLSSLIKFNNKLCIASVFLIGIGIISNWTYKNYIKTQINSNIEALAELHDRYNKRTNQWTLITNDKDYPKIKQREKQNNPIEVYYSDQTIQDIETAISNQRSISKRTLFAITLKEKENGNIDIFSERSKCRHVLSVFFSKNKKERKHVYRIESNADIFTLSENKSIEPMSGILKNGDLEVLDTPEQSFKKLKSHIGRYSLFFDYDESIRTPVNAYFYNASIFTDRLPYYNCLNDKAISGKHSAKIGISKGAGYLLFYQRFDEGSYEYSIIFSGKTGTTVCILYDLYKDKKWNVMPLATYTISTKGTFRIGTSFSVSDLNPGEYFLVGAWVNGEAYLDNFNVVKTDGQMSETNRNSK